MRLKTAVSSCVSANFHFGFLWAPCAKPLCLLHFSSKNNIFLTQNSFFRCLFQRTLPRPTPGSHFGGLWVSPGISWRLLGGPGTLLWIPLGDPLGAFWGPLGAPWDAFGELWGALGSLSLRLGSAATAVRPHQYPHPLCPKLRCQRPHPPNILTPS